MLHKKAIANIVNDVNRTAVNASIPEIEGVAKELFDIDKEISKLEKRSKELKSEIKKYMTANKLDSVTSEYVTAYISKITPRTIDNLRILKALPPEMINEILNSLSTEKIDDLVKTLIKEEALTDDIEKKHEIKRYLDTLKESVKMEYSKETERINIKYNKMGK